MRHPRLSSAAGPARAGAGPAAGPAVPPLVAVAHGSADPRAAATIAELMELVRELASRDGLPALDARTAYLGHAPPSVRQVLGALAGPAPQLVVVLPLLLTAAYHSEVDLPAMLDEARRALPGLSVSYGEVLGPDPLLLRALDRRLAESGVAGPARDTAVVLAAAGSGRPAANAAVARLAASWQAARGWRAVVPAYASAAAPAPAAAVSALLRDGAPRVVVATYLLAPGVFADQVAEASLRAGASAVSGALGASPELATLILRRYAEAVARPGRAGRDPEMPARLGSCR
ncbi:MAG: CbiX/SirB N-terminal domain-containing protein [Streptosporangiaceae bacterium]